MADFDNADHVAYSCSCHDHSFEELGLNAMDNAISSSGYSRRSTTRLVDRPTRSHLAFVRILQQGWLLEEQAPLAMVWLLVVQILLERFFHSPLFTIHGLQELVEIILPLIRTQFDRIWQYY